jgi:hypothetical protein
MPSPPHRSTFSAWPARSGEVEPRLRCSRRSCHQHGLIHGAGGPPRLRLLQPQEKSVPAKDPSRSRSKTSGQKARNL